MTIKLVDEYVPQDRDRSRGRESGCAGYKTPKGMRRMKPVVGLGKPIRQVRIISQGEPGCFLTSSDRCDSILSRLGRLVNQLS